DWLLDPLNPHLIAATRANAYTRYTLMALVRCFLEYADAEFTRDTPESVPRARSLYMTALRLLEVDELKQSPSKCDELVQQLDRAMTDTASEPVWQRLRNRISAIPDYATLSAAAAKIRDQFEGNEPWPARIGKAKEIVAHATAGAEPDNDSTF